MSSEHKAVLVKIEISEAIVKQKFLITRNLQNVNVANIMELLENENNFEEKLESNDVNRITEGLLKKLNKVADTLAPRWRIQICKNMKSSNGEEAKKLCREAKDARSRAIETKDPEDFRQVQNKAAVGARKIMPQK